MTTTGHKTPSTKTLTRRYLAAMAASELAQDEAQLALSLGRDATGLLAEAERLDKETTEAWIDLVTRRPARHVTNGGA